MGQSVPGRPLFSEREKRASPEAIENTGSLGLFFSAPRTLDPVHIRGVSCRKDFVGWTLVVRVTIAGEQLVGFSHLNCWADMGSQVKDMFESDVWVADKFAEVGHTH
jgi:hypothetical protein